MPKCLPRIWKLLVISFFFHHLCILGDRIGPVKAFIINPNSPSSFHLHSSSLNNRPSQHEPYLEKKLVHSKSLSLSALVDREGSTYSKGYSYDEEDIIPREHLFENPEFRDPSISPDGQHIAYLAPHPTDGSFPYIYVLPVSSLSGRGNDGNNHATNDSVHLKSARRVTDGGSRGLTYFFWGEDSQTIFYLQDKKGFENYHLWAVDIYNFESETSLNDNGILNDANIKPARDLTPGDLKVQQVFKSPFHPNQLLITTNQRDKSLFDVYRCNYAGDSSSLELDTVNPGNVVGWGAIATKDEFEICRANVRCQHDASTTLLIRNSMIGHSRQSNGNMNNEKIVNNDKKNYEWRELYTWPYGEDGSFIEFLKDENTCLLTSSVDRDTTSLLKIDLSTGETLEEIFRHEKCDIGKIILDSETKNVQAVSYTYARTEWEYFDPWIEEHYRELSDNIAPTPDTLIDVRNTSKDQKLWLVAFVQSDAPTQFYLYDCNTKNAQSLFCARPILLNYKLASMESVQITARDGLELVGYLTRSRSDSIVGGMSQKSPLILCVHGGPWDRDHWTFSPTHIWFANRGYSTLSVNFRGSAGFGKKFKNLGDKEWGVGAMQHDLTDAVQWAIDQGIADESKICIYGGSYGGYCVLAGLAFTPDLYACGIDMVGPSNVKTLMDSIPNYWKPLRNQMMRRVGDVDNDPDFNRRISPLFHVDKIQAPLMIAHGSKDVRVKQRESDQIAFSMKAKGIPIDYVVYPNEGHGIRRPPNRVDFMGRVELFLQEHLGGRSQDFEVPVGSSAYFPLEDDISNNKK